MLKSNGKKSNIVNKFNVVEDQIEINSKKYSIGRNEILNMKSFDQTTKKKSNEKDTIYFLKLFFKKNSESIIIISKKFFTFIKSQTVSLRNEIKEKRQNFELLLKNNIKKLETDFDKKENHLAELNRKKSDSFLSFEKTIIQIFNFKNLNISVKDDESNGSNLFRLHEDEVIFSYLLQKINDKNLLSNVFSIDIISELKQAGTAKHQISFELNSNGFKWSYFFSKHLAQDLNLFIQLKNGNYKFEYVNNLTLGRDKFIIEIETGLEENTNKMPDPRKKTKSLSELGL